jgi:hypothetical protein
MQVGNNYYNDNGGGHVHDDYNDSKTRHRTRHGIFSSRIKQRYEHVIFYFNIVSGCEHIGWYRRRCDGHCELFGG